MKSMFSALIAAVSAIVVLTGCGSSSSPPSATATSGAAATATTTRQITFNSAPPMTINENGNYAATVVTNDGTFKIQLLPKVAPLAVNNFVFLARHHYYDGVIFHRIISNFMVQTGDPTGTGTGGPGYSFRIEKTSLPYTLGTVAMANTGQANSNGSQFFIIVVKSYPLQPNYTVFGKVISGMSAVLKIAQTPVGPSPGNQGEISYPLKTVLMKKVTIQAS